MRKRIVAAAIVAAVGVGTGLAATGAVGAGAGPVLADGSVGGAPSLADVNPAIASALAQVPGQATEVSTLQHQGVSVTVDGTPVSLSAVASHALGYMENAIESAGTVAAEDGADVSTAVAQAASPSQAVAQSVALVTLQQLLYDAAVQQGTVASTAAAQAYAQQNYDMYVSSYDHPSPYTAALPAPQRSDFLSSAAVANYQYTLTVNDEMQHVAGASSQPTAGPDGVAGASNQQAAGGVQGAGETPALQAWMTDQLANGSVQIANVPGVTAANVASFLPPGLGS